MDNLEQHLVPYKLFTATELEQRIDEITRYFGSKYQWTFC